MSLVTSGGTPHEREHRPDTGAKEYGQDKVADVLAGAGSNPPPSTTSETGSPPANPKLELGVFVTRWTVLMRVDHP